MMQDYGLFCINFNAKLACTIFFTEIGFSSSATLYNTIELANIEHLKKT